MQDLSHGIYTGENKLLSMIVWIHIPHSLLCSYTSSICKGQNSGPTVGILEIPWVDLCRRSHPSRFALRSLGGGAVASEDQAVAAGA